MTSPANLFEFPAPVEPPDEKAERGREKHNKAMRESRARAKQGLVMFIGWTTRDVLYGMMEDGEMPDEQADNREQRARLIGQKAAKLLERDHLKKW